ncbi:MAG: sugar phosphate isomerase/epimerase family protein [Pirellulales bacterium]
MPLGLVTYNWGKDWDLPTVIKNCEETGFAGVELRSTHAHGVEPTLNDMQRAEVAQRFADSSVELVGLGTACEYHSPDPAVVKQNIEESKAFIKLCHDCGGSGIKVRPNGLPAGVPVAKTLEQIGRALNEVGEYGAGYGVQIRLEVHGRGTSEVPNIKRIMDVATNPNVFVCWNCNQSDLDGEGLAHNFGLVADRLGTIHVHDLISDYPWPELFGLLHKSSFTGWQLVEEGQQTSDPVRVMKYYRMLWERMNAEAAS